jgi:hypothetical protein
MDGRIAGSTLLLLSALLAGCADASSMDVAPVRSDIPVSDEEAIVNDTAGAIEGHVLTDELLPAANGTVGVFETAQTVRVTETGRFVFSRLAPGAYKVQASALGYQSQVRRVDVVAGEVTAAEFQLEAGAVEGPFHETEIHKGIVRSVVWRVGARCETLVQPPIGTCLGIQFDDVTFFYDSEPDWATYVDEVRWIPNSAVVHQRAYVFATFPNVTDFQGVPDFKSPGHFEAGGTSPVTLRIERTQLRERNFPEQNHHGRTRFRAVNNFDDVNATVVAAGVMIDQPIEVYLSIFYQERAPLEFSALPDR